MTVTGDVNLGGHLLMDMVAHNLHDVLNVSGTLTIGPTATLEINGTTDFTQLDFAGDFGLVTNDRVHVIHAAAIVGSFSNVTANQSFLDAAGRSILFGADADGLFLMAASPVQAVPEPRAIIIWLLMLAVVGYVYRRTLQRQEPLGR